MHDYKESVITTSVGDKMPLGEELEPQGCGCTFSEWSELVTTGEGRTMLASGE